MPSIGDRSTDYFCDGIHALLIGAHEEAQQALQEVHALLIGA